MLFMESLQKVYYCPLKANRQVDESGGQPYQRVDTLDWSPNELQQGKRLKTKGFPKNHKMQCFRVEGSTHRTDFVSPTIWLRILHQPHNRRVAGVGRLSNCIEKVSR